MSDSDANHEARLAVDLRSIRKSFYGTAANDGVDFNLRWGEVHALLGENGAGKSTLCSVLAGLYRPDSGEIVVDGQPHDFRSPHQALVAGIGMVYQHFRLVQSFTVAENLVLGQPGAGFRLSLAALERQAAELVERFGLQVDPAARIWQLSVGEQQRVEILKLLYRDVRILILDEPTAVLTPQETQVLFRTVRSLAADGRAIVFVSHKLDEVLQIADRVTVLRDGQRVGAFDRSETTRALLARLMVGRDLPTAERRPGSSAGDPILQVTGLRVTGDRGHEAVRGLDLEIRAGQIVGVAGVAGNGQRELCETIAGLRKPTEGHVLLGEEDVSRASPLARIGLGLGFVPEDRLGTALAPGLSLDENLILKAYRQRSLSIGPLLSARAIRRRTQDLIRQFDVKGVRRGLPVRLLSGGNLQRGVLAREISQDPRVLVAASPTRGLDVGATEAIRKLLLDQRDRGVGILLVSEDLDEIRALSDRILVIYEGRIVGEVDPASFDLETIGLLMAGSVPAMT